MKHLTMEHTNNKIQYLLIFAVIMALVTSIVYLRESQTIGRLSQDITYDDVGYVNDAVSRLTVGYNHGLISFVKTFAVNPPHSPFSTILACTALVLGGYNDSAVYASNAILLVTVAVSLVCLFNNAGPGTVIWIVITFLSSPLAYGAIHEFRPDIALGLMTAAMVYLFSAALYYGKSRYFMVAGIAFGACLLIKPTFFAHTLVLAIGLVILHMALTTKWAAYISSRIAIPRRVESIRFLAIGFLVTVPYYVFNAKHIFLYFWTNTRGAKSSIWSFSSDTSWLAVARQYLLGSDVIAANRLGGAHIIIVALSVIAGVILMVYRRKLKELLISWTLLYSALISLLIIVIGRHKNDFFLSSFYSLLFLAGFFSFAFILQEVGRAGRRTLLVVAWLALGLTVYGNSSLVYWQPSAEASVFRSWNSKVVTAVANDMLHYVFMPAEKVKLFVAMAGPVNAETIKWTATKQGVDIYPFDIHTSDAIDDFVIAARESHYILVPNENNSEYYRWLPSGLVQSKFLTFLRSAPQFQPVNLCSKDDHYYLFINHGAIAPVIDVEEITALKGFGPIEGPYPQWNLPRVRWMTDSEATLCFEATAPHRYKANMRYRPESDGNLIITNPNGKLIKSDTFRVNEFTETMFTFSVMAGQQCLHLSAQMGTPPDAKRLLLFTKLTIEKQP